MRKGQVMNLIKTMPLAASPCPAVRDPAEIRDRHTPMLTDESRLQADSVKTIYFPRSVEEIAGAFRELREGGMTCVISGGRTGITGGAVPIGADAVISMERMKGIYVPDCEGERFFVRTEAGVTLKELEEELARRAREGGPALWFPVDPTERSAQLGGMAATNASGPRTYLHGSTREWIRGLAMVLSDGSLLKVRRGDVQADGRLFRITDADGASREIVLPDTAVPRVKNAAGYFIRPGTDLVDLLVGSEGTLGIIAEIEFRLEEKPEATLGILIGTKDEEAALDLVEAARKAKDIPLQAIEYFDTDSIRLLNERKQEEGEGGALPEFPFHEGAAVYLEMAGTEPMMEAAGGRLESLLLSLGIPADRTWAARNERDLEHQKLFRHAVPETVNAWIGRRKQAYPDLHKVGTDFAVPDSALRKMFSLYRRGLREKGLQSVVFGHIGNNHVHVNVLPRNTEEMEAAGELYLKWAREAVSLGGSVSGEHGIGRLKKELLKIQYPPEVLEAMRLLRKAFDPAGILAPGVLL
jgi:D-lactate dehydrogenase (cytochrome)